MSDLENVDVMLGNHSRRNDLDNQLGERETEEDLENNGLQTANPISVDLSDLWIVQIAEKTVKLPLRLRG